MNVGRKGATFEVMNVSLEIPPEALERKVTITLVISCNESDLSRLTAHLNDDDKRLVGPVIDCLPRGLKFKKPVMLSFDYGQAGQAAIVPPNMHIWCR